ncbi:hypothetical protein [Paenibacillus fonticola]|uniref:hypothetical protein n=1 Tax=Paenibacillus fonticola TaxID=379896 RepID=UPI00035F3C24|nr:hypothetical protein [Paenibacillus fonticola]
MYVINQKLIAALLALFMLLGCLANTAMAADSKKISLDVISNYTSLIPGQSVMVGVRISTKELPDDMGLRAAKIILSYDESIFTTDGNIRFDETLGMDVWRGDTFFIPSSNNDYSIETPYPMDIDPTDGRKEVTISVSANNGKLIRATSDEAFVSFFLTVKEGISSQNTSIKIQSALLEDHSGKAIQNFAATSADILVDIPKSIDVVRGTLPPTADPFKVSVDIGIELNALANFDNGDTAYVTEMVTWQSTDTQILKVHSPGSIRTIGLGTAAVTVTLGSITGKHDITVLSPTDPELNVQEEAYVIVTYIPPSQRETLYQEIPVTVNGKVATSGRMIEGSVYVPLRSTSDLLGVKAGYDSSKKAPTINGTTIKEFKILSGSSYIKAREIPSILGAKIIWDSTNKSLSIEYNS